MKETNRFIFGIEELDEIFGNVDLGNVILIAGNPGTGKTTFASKIAYENMIKFGLKTLYISFIEKKDEYFKNLKNLGLDIEDLEKKGLFTFLEEITFTNKELLIDLLNHFLDIIDKTNSKILIIDSISSLLQLSQNAIDLREILHNLFYRISKVKGITTILIEEVPYGSDKIGFGIEEFLVDTIIFLKAIDLKGKMVRIAEIKKARGSNITLTTIPFTIKYGKVISLLYPKKSNKVIKHKTLNVKLGNNEFHINTGSQNLIISHFKIDSFSLASLIIAGALIGTPYLLQDIKRKVLIRLRNSVTNEFYNHLKNCLINFGIQKNIVDDLTKNYIIDGIDPNQFNIVDYFDHVKEIEEKEKPAFVLNIGLDELLEVLADDKIYPTLELDALTRRINNNITTLYIIKGTLKDYQKIPLTEYYDNVWYFYPTKDNKLNIRPFRIKMKLFSNEIYTVDIKSIPCFS